MKVTADRDTVWIFDLDNTLHDADAHVFPFLHGAMNDYIESRLGLSPDGATALRHHYWKRYGATLCGLMKHHGTDPAEFLRTTHRFPDLNRMILANRGLRTALRRLPGRKVVFSNAPLHYAEPVVQRLGIAPHLDAIFTIERTSYRPKPDASGFYRLLRQLRTVAARCVMVEDTLVNLRTAKRLGMTTVWVDATGRRPSFVDAVVPTVARLPTALLRVRRAG